MGNSFGCSASGERLVSAARDGDLVEARMLLEFNPGLAKYSTFGGLNSPLHFAAARGHNEIVALLLEKGADVNSRNYCGQTALMHACRYGHWEVVQSLLLYHSNVIRADYLSGRTALHFAAVNGHVRCIRLVVADFVPSAPHEVISSHSSQTSGEGRPATNSSNNTNRAGSTPLHYAACGGNLKCCQILLGRGASRFTLNCNGWLPLDVARIWGRHWLEPLLTPSSDLELPAFPPSVYLSLPLMSALNIAREYGLQSSSASADDSDVCAVCLEKACTVAAEGCGHELCVRCALYLCSASNIPSDMVGPPGSIPCPLCRNGIISFIKLSNSPAEEELKQHLSLGLCTPCMLHHDPEPSPTSLRPEIRKNRVASVSSDFSCPVSCSPFPSVPIPMCTCNEDSCPSFEPSGRENEDESPRRSSQGMIGGEEDKTEGTRFDKTTCSSIFWTRRSCHREHQCNSEINA
ncbi:hypothetical protein MKX01_033706 [Papaver californicum]|nr:hypothetical protein MKX01_033706 [Papaver californicum]